jgi:transposase-like protein
MSHGGWLYHRFGWRLRDRAAAEQFLRRVLDGCGSRPRVVITDKLASYPPAIRRVLPGAVPAPRVPARGVAAATLDVGPQQAVGWRGQEGHG